jgi:uncharacterized alkaline shock family protein YloU
MSETTGTTPAARATQQTPAASGVKREQTASLTTDEGTTTIADGVVSKIAGIAAREVVGVHDVGGGASRAFGSIRERIPGSTTNYSQGVSVEVGTEEAAIDLEIVAEYGVAISDVAQSVRRNVISSIERMTGLRVTEVNVNVNDVHLPEDEAGSGLGSAPSNAGGETAEPRVR